MNSLDEEQCQDVHHATSHVFHELAQGPLKDTFRPAKWPLPAWSLGIFCEALWLQLQGDIVAMQAALRLSMCSGRRGRQSSCGLASTIRGEGVAGNGGCRQLALARDADAILYLGTAYFRFADDKLFARFEQVLLAAQNFGDMLPAW